MSPQDELARLPAASKSSQHEGMWSFPHLGGDPGTIRIKPHSLQVLTLQLQRVQINSDKPHFSSA